MFLKELGLVGDLKYLTSKSSKDLVILAELRIVAFARKHQMWSYCILIQWKDGA